MATTTFLVAHYINVGYSAELSSVSVTMSNPRPSFVGALAAGNTVGSNLVTINTTAGSYPSTSSAQLVEGDVLAIGNGATLHSYTVASTSSLAVIETTAALVSGDSDTGDSVIGTQSATLDARFTTSTAVPNGKFQVLVPAVTTNALSNDGIPDQGLFDNSVAGPTVTCPASVANYSFTATVSAVSSVTINGVDYHSYTCTYAGTGEVGTVFNGSAFNGHTRQIRIAGLINPAPISSHTSGTADAYSVIVRHLTGADVVVDTTVTKVGVIEAVRVTASISPQLSFKIIGLAAGTSACGNTTSVTTSPTAVPFGDLSITAFTDAAQAMSISTNAAGGYAVTAIENDQLGRNGVACAGDPTTNASCIQDARPGTMSDTVNSDWSSTASVGFGYSLHDVNGTTTEAFAYGASTFSAKQFADAEAGQSAVNIFSDTTVAANDNIYVCYRVIPDVTNAAGFYENYITYTATATF